MYLKFCFSNIHRLDTSIELPSNLHSSVYENYEPCRQFQLVFAKLSSNSSHTMHLISSMTENPCNYTNDLLFQTKPTMSST